MPYDSRVNHIMEKGSSLMDAGCYEEALKCFNECLEYEQNSSEIWLCRAAALRHSGNREEAIRSCEVALGCDSENADAWAEKGAVLCDLGRCEEAIKFCEIALRYNQGSEEAWLSKGMALLELCRFEEAITSFEELLRYVPDLALAWFYKGYALARLERHAEAIKFYDIALRYRPDFLAARYGKGDALQLLELDQNQSADVSSVAKELKTALDKALKEIWEEKSTLGRFPLMGCSRLIFDITQSLLGIGFLQEAQIAGAEARKVVPRIREQYEDCGLDPLFDVFRTFVVLGRIEDALTLAQEISSVYEIPLTDEEKNLPLRLVSKSLAEDIGDFGRATQVVQQIADPQVREYALGDVCEALARAGHFSEAVEVAQEISDNSTEYFRSFFLIQICEELCERKQYRQATSVCEAMNMDALSFRCSALLRIAEGLAKEQQIDEMRVILREAMEIPNEDKDWSLSRASEVLAQAGEFDESLETAKGISERHYYHTALSAISEALAAKGQIDRALEIAHECEGVESEALCGISQALAKTGRFEESKTIALKIADANKRSDALAYLGTALAGEAKAVQAFQVAMKISDEYGYKRHDTFDVLIKALASCGRVDEAIQTSLGWDSVSRVLMLAHIYWAIEHRESS